MADTMPLKMQTTLLSILLIDTKVIAFPRDIIYNYQGIQGNRLIIPFPNHLTVYIYIYSDLHQVHYHIKGLIPCSDQIDNPSYV